MKSIFHLISIGFIVTFIFSGCATKRGEVSLQTPTSMEAVQPNGQEVMIRNVNDARRFETAPSEPNTPSLDPEEAQNSDIRSRAIARKRNTYGKALGDILLKEGQTVTSVIRDSLAQAFIEKGYKVVTEPTPETIIVDVEVEQFWSWMNPGFWAITLSTEISTDIDMKRPDGMNKEKVYVKTSGKYQTAAGGNWVEVMHKALAEYIAAVKTKI